VCEDCTCTGASSIDVANVADVNNFEDCVQFVYHLAQCGDHLLIDVSDADDIVCDCYGPDENCDVTGGGAIDSHVYQVMGVGN
jgi:hypothetical protein